MISRIRWIDQLRGFAMMAILLFHTEIYFTGSELIPYNLYVGNVLVAFFFCSGFLFANENKPFSARRKLKGIFRSLIIPYFFFTLLIAFPKAFFNGRSTDIADLLLGVIMGRASWFVSALIVSELIMLLIYYFFARKEKLMLLISIVLSLTAFFFGNLLHDEHMLFPQDYWSITESMLVMPFLCIGIMLRRRQQLVARFSTLLYILPALLVFVSLKVFVIHEGLSEVVCPLKISSWLLFMFNNLLGIFLFVTILSRIDYRMPMIEWTGRHSLVYYFFCGGIPLLTSLVLHRFGIFYNQQYWRVLAAFIIVYGLSTAVAWFFYRYTPWILNKKRA